MSLWVCYIAALWLFSSSLAKEAKVLAFEEGSIVSESYCSFSKFSYYLFDTMVPFVDDWSIMKVLFICERDRFLVSLGEHLGDVR